MMSAECSGDGGGRLVDVTLRNDALARRGSNRCECLLHTLIFLLRKER